MDTKKDIYNGIQQKTRNELDGLANIADILLITLAIIIVTSLILFAK